MKKLILFIALSIASSLAAAETLYVQSLKAELKTEPNFKAKTAATAMKGEPLTVIGKSSTWYKVSRQGKEGWVFRYVVAAKPPMGKVSTLAQDARELDKGARRRASVVTTTAAVRGLSAEDRARNSRNSMINFDALEKMDNMVINDNEAIAFLNQRP
jgi:uncharacterized protein YgiM (DUF1202 family)